jgi:hypothetical protein
VVCETNASLEFPQSGPVVALPLVELSRKDEMAHGFGLVRAFLLDHRKGLVHRPPRAGDVPFEPSQVRQLTEPSDQHQPIPDLTEQPDHLFDR